MTEKSIYAASKSPVRQAEAGRRHRQPIMLWDNQYWLNTYQIRIRVLQPASLA
ncbi:MAG: hypothetical protein ACUVRL_06595 [Candidatus Saccharicenans sp.]|uniref:hypothetical protein n=1 Tax=Candidatus Saccharicenans sp. TaxID=2819258 RepID=UPI00404A1233